MSCIITRPAKFEEIPQIYELVKSLRFEHEDLDDKYTMSEEVLLKQWRIGFFDIDVVADNNSIYGFMLYQKNFHQEMASGIYLAAYFVKKEIRGKGLGSKMILSLFERTEELKKAFLCLMYHEIERYAFYQKFGFVNEKQFTMFEKLTENLPKYLLSELSSYCAEESGVVSVTSAEVTRHDVYPVTVFTCCTTADSLEVTVQVNYCSWRGPVVFISNMKGCVRLFASPLLFLIVRRFLQEYQHAHYISDIWIDVPREDKDVHLFLDDHDFDNVTSEHWFRTCVYRENMDIENIKNRKNTFKL